MLILPVFDIKMTQGKNMTLIMCSVDDRRSRTVPLLWVCLDMEPNVKLSEWLLF